MARRSFITSAAISFTDTGLGMSETVEKRINEMRGVIYGGGEILDELTADDQEMKLYD